MDGKNVRLSGEDVKRGTFTHRHAVWTDEKTDQQFNRLERCSTWQSKVDF
jgi:2-oxoglutarate dehydrogenase E1 component